MARLLASIRFGVQAFLGQGIRLFGFTTGWTTVGETGFVRLQLEFF